MKAYYHLEKLSDISDDYDIFLIDLWGVIHNGIRIFKNVKSVLKKLKEKNKSVFFITNAPRRSDVIQQQLNDFGIMSDLYNKVISSGELSINSIPFSSKCSVRSKDIKLFFIISFKLINSLFSL